MCHVRIVGIFSGVSCVVHHFVFVGGGYANMDCVVGQIHKERLGAVTTFLQPRYGVIADDVAGVSLDRTFGLSIDCEEITRMFLRVDPEFSGKVWVFFGYNPVVEPLLLWEGPGPSLPIIADFPIGAVKVPFTEDSGLIVTGLQNLGNRDFVTVQ